MNSIDDGFDFSNSANLEQDENLSSDSGGDSRLQEPLSVSSLLSKVKDMLESEFRFELKVQGEVSGFKSYDSGHWYFSIKDEEAQLSCTMFKYANRHLKHKPQDGDMVVLTGQPGIYKTRGQFQFIASDLVRAGEGNIRAEFERTKQRLLEEGLFAPEQKQPIPTFIQRLCIISSPQGAAMHDVMSVLQRRMPLMRVFLAPSLVQGEQAAANIIEMLELVNKRGDFDAVLITRGGGSAEDLHCFNDEKLARAIYASKLPVISAVGHEVDYTICDFVADHRSPTPSAAAEELSIDCDEVRQQLLGHADRMHSILQYQLNDRAQDLDDLWQRTQRVNFLQRPGAALDALQRQLGYLLRTQLGERRELLARYRTLVHMHNPYVQHKGKYEELTSARIKLKQAVGSLLRRRRDGLTADRRMLTVGFNNYLAREKTRLGYQSIELRAESARLNRVLKTRLQQLMTQTRQQKEILDAVNPSSLLARGYSLARDADGNLVMDAAQLKQGDLLRLQLARGIAETEVKSTKIQH